MRIPRELADLARRQDFVLTTTQCLAAGMSGSWIDRQVRDGRWQRRHLGVLVTHSGPLTWRTSARAALLHAGPGAALSHAAAGHVHQFIATAPRVIDVVIPHARRLRPSLGVRLHRRVTFVATGRLPVLGRGDTVVDLVATARSEDAALGLVCDAVRAGTHAVEVLQAVDQRPTARRRSLLRMVLAEVEAGIESPLEHRYHHRVERAHGLPTARLQAQDVVDGRWIRSDRRYDAFGLRIELDGQLGHPGGTTDGDVWRDNAVLLEHADLTLRYRWRHVHTTPCATAAQVAQALGSRGWTHPATPCGPGCALMR